MWTGIQNWLTGLSGGVRLADADFWQSILIIIRDYGPSFIDGAKNTLIIATVCTILGCIIGLAVGIVQTIPVAKKDSPLKKGLVYLSRWLLNAYVEIFRGTPMMLQAMLFFYGLPLMFNLVLDVWPTAFLVVAINTGAYMAETVRGGILSIDPGQTEGAKAIGMTHVQTMVHVILPQTMRNIMPQIGNNLIINVKDTCVLSVIGFSELFFKYRSASGATWAYFPSAVIVMVIYFIMTFTLSRILRFAEKKMEGSDSYDLATQDTLAHTTGMYSYPGKGSNFDERHLEPADLDQTSSEGKEGDGDA